MSLVNQQNLYLLITRLHVSHFKCTLTYNISPVYCKRGIFRVYDIWRTSLWDISFYHIKWNKHYIKRKVKQTFIIWVLGQKCFEPGHSNQKVQRSGLRQLFGSRVRLNTLLLNSVNKSVLHVSYLVITTKYPLPGYNNLLFRYNWKTNSIEQNIILFKGVFFSLHRIFFSFIHTSP